MCGLISDHWNALNCTVLHSTTAAMSLKQRAPSGSELRLGHRNSVQPPKASDHPKRATTQSVRPPKACDHPKRATTQSMQPPKAGNQPKRATTQSRQPPRVCFPSVVILIENVVRFRCRPKVHYRNSRVIFFLQITSYNFLPLVFWFIL